MADILEENYSSPEHHLWESYKAAWKEELWYSWFGEKTVIPTPEETPVTYQGAMDYLIKHIKIPSYPPFKVGKVFRKDEFYIGMRVLLDKEVKDDSLKFCSAFEYIFQFPRKILREKSVIPLAPTKDKGASIERTKRRQING